jgi:AcrR family transcriptional regulator
LSVSPSPAKSIDTRQRLLEAAGEVFAEVGFRSATIQEICRRAGANIAAVHYHFSDKEQLYRAVVEYADHCAMASYPIDARAGSDLPADRRLRALIESFLLRLLDEGRPAWHGKLMAREMVEPTEALDTIVQEKVRHTHEQFGVVVRELLGRRAPPETVRRCALSIIGQCVFYRQSQPILTRMFPAMRLGRAEVDSLAEHIARFSLAGIGAMTKELEGHR